MIVYRFSPAACPVAKAICRLKPPVYASTSRISPAKYKPGINLDCIVFPPSQSRRKAVQSRKSPP